MLDDWGWGFKVWGLGVRGICCGIWGVVYRGCGALLAGEQRTQPLHLPPEHLSEDFGFGVYCLLRIVFCFLFFVYSPPPSTYATLQS